MIVPPAVPLALILVKADRAAGGPIDHVLFKQKTFASFVNEEAIIRGSSVRKGRPLHIVDVVAAQDGPGLKAESIDAPAVGQN